VEFIRTVTKLMALSPLGSLIAMAYKRFHAASQDVSRRHADEQPVHGGQLITPTGQ
jgi:hypothetical protein